MQPIRLATRTHVVGSIAISKAELLHHRDRRLTGQDASGVQLQGSNSSRRRLGQLLTSLVRTSATYASGLMPCNLHVSISEASIAQFSAPSSEPAKSAFFLLRATGRMLRSTVLESISMRPSSRKCRSPSH